MTLAFDSLPRLALFLLQANLVWALGFLVTYQLMKGLSPRIRYTAQLALLAVLPVSILIAWALNHPATRSITEPVTVSIYSGSVLLEALENDPQSGAPANKLHLAVRYTLWTVGVIGTAGVFLLGVRFWTRLSQLFIFAGTPHPRIQARLNSFAQELGLRQPIRLLLAKLNLSPFSYGFRKARIVMPSSLLSKLSEEETDLILRHELHHIRRRDFHINVIQKLIRVAFFYNPCVHWLDRSIELDREFLCDQAVLESSRCTKRQYAELLLRVAEYAAKYPMLSPQVTFHTKQTHLRKRLQQMKNNRTIHPAPWRAGFTLAALIVSFVTISLTGYGKNVEKKKHKKGTKDKLTFEINDDQLTIRRNGETHRFDADSKEYQKLIQQYERLISNVEGTAPERQLKSTSQETPLNRPESSDNSPFQNTINQWIPQERQMKQESAVQGQPSLRQRALGRNQGQLSSQQTPNLPRTKAKPFQFRNEQLLPGKRPPQSRNSFLDRERLVLEEMRQELRQHQELIAKQQQELQEQITRQNVQIQRKIQINQDLQKQLINEQKRLATNATAQAQIANQKARENTDRARKAQLQILQLKQELASEGVINADDSDLNIELNSDHLKVNGEIQNEDLFERAQDLLNDDSQKKAKRTLRLKESR